MAKFLIDVNLPYYFSLWNNEDYIHQKDIDDEWTDLQIWEYARENNLTIITKDKDFSTRILASIPPPKVIHVRFGNLKMAAFFEVVIKNWDAVCELNNDFKLVNFFIDRLEAIK